MRCTDAVVSACTNSALTGTFPVVSNTTRTVVSVLPVSGQSDCLITRPRSSCTGLSGAVEPKGAAVTRIASRSVRVAGAGGSAGAERRQAS
ncbi:hypothetical protein LUW77_02425 [Streptomyces radiopugnans]|nr:hypothetical protein LUW77_02425 [Streptomyces radiopugnans]